MLVILEIMAAVLAFMVVYHFLTRRYLNPYKLVMVFGKKGSGKSTLLTKLALQYHSEGRPVYSTEYIPGTYKIDYQDIGYKQFPKDSVILIDEVGMIWDNRNFKSFDTKVRDWFKLQRHYGCTVYLFSQTFDVDKKIRDLVDEMYLVEKKFRVFSYSKKILKRIVLNASTADAPSNIAENLEFDSFLFFWAGSRKLTFIPKYAKYFDSFIAPQLEEEDWDYTDFPEGLRPKRRSSAPHLSSFFLSALAPLRKRGGQARKELGGVSSAEQILKSEVETENPRPQ